MPVNREAAAGVKTRSKKVTVKLTFVCRQGVNKAPEVMKHTTADLKTAD